MAPNTRDRNIFKIIVALPLLSLGAFRALRAVAVAALPKETPALAGVGLLFLAYAVARAAVALRGWTPRRLRPPRAERFRREGAYLRAACGGAVVTGCTSGLGRAFAEGLAARGVPVVPRPRGHVAGPSREPRRGVAASSG